MSLKFQASLFRISAIVKRNAASTSTSLQDAIKPLSAIPGPRPLPFVGNLKEIQGIPAVKDKDEHVLTKLTQKYGNIAKLGFLNKTTVIINDADALRVIFNNEGTVPVRNTMLELNHKWIHEKNKIPLGIIFAHKNDWKKLRSATTKQVTPRRLTHFDKPFSAIADDLCDYIDDKRDNEGWIGDVWEPLKLWAMKGITKVVIGEDLDIFDQTNDQAQAYMKASLDYMHGVTEINGAIPLYKLFPTKPYKHYINAYNGVRKQAKMLLDKHYDELRASIEAGSVNEDIAVGLLDQWLIEGQLTEEQAIVQACDMIQAGIDTTSCTAAFMLHELAKHPDIQEAVREEVLSVVGPHDAPTADQIQKLSLARKCVKETLRLYPILPYSFREIINDIEMLGYRIPAGTHCGVNFLTLAVDPRYFKDPLTFNPERWSNSDDIHPFASLPFGFGPRGCYGRRIAELELHILLTRILQRFKMSTNQKQIKQSVLVIIYPDEPLKIHFASRQ